MILMDQKQGLRVDHMELGLIVGFDPADYARLQELADAADVKLRYLIRAMVLGYLREHPDMRLFSDDEA